MAMPQYPPQQVAWIDVHLRVHPWVGPTASEGRFSHIIIVSGKVYERGRVWHRDPVAALAAGGEAMKAAIDRIVAEARKALDDQ